MKAKVAAVAAIIPLVLAATAAGATTEPAGTEPGDAEPGGGGTMVWGKPAELIEFDPHTSLNGVSWQLLYLAYETLVEIGPELEIEPGLAESWDTPSDTEYVFHLRPGVTFSNGRAMTADDVVQSFERLRDPELAAFWAGQLGPVESIEAPDDSTVRFTLSSPYTPFLAALANVNASIMPMQELADGSFDPDSEMLGTGPYMVAEHNQDESWVFERNPHYWRAGYPKLDRVEVRIITDDTARVAALRDGSIDIALFENVDAPLVLEGVDNVETVIQDTTDYWRIDVNEIWDQAKLTNDDVRFAVNMAIDREQIRDVALGGLGTPTAATPPGFVESCDPSAVPSAARDLDRARQILAENDAEDLSFTLIASPYLPQIPAIAQVVQQNLAEIDVDVEIAQLEVGDWQTRVFSDNPGTFDAAMSWFAGYADPAMVVSWWNPETALWNQGFLEPNAEITDLIGQAQTLPAGSAERIEALAQACNAIDQDAGIIPLVTRTVVVAYRSDQISPVIHPIEGYIDQFRFISEFEEAAS
jgi:peptide/nickel transport system substrate-binding protein